VREAGDVVAEARAPENARQAGLVALPAPLRTPGIYPWGGLAERSAQGGAEAMAADTHGDPEGVTRVALRWRAAKGSSGEIGSPAALGERAALAAAAASTAQAKRDLSVFAVEA